MTIRDIVREILDEESAAAKAAKKAGLVHLGFGRYGPKKGDSATHVSKGGKLVSVGGDTGGGEPEDKPFGGDTGTDADFQGEPPDDRYASYDDMTAMLDDPDEPEYRTDDPEDKKEPEQSEYDKMGPEARELKTTMDSTEEGYKQQYIPILKNLSRKMKKGVYDKEKAVKLMMYYVDNGAKKYGQDYGGGGATGPSIGGFDKKTREEAARAYVEDFEDDWDNKNWDFMESIKELGEIKMNESITFNGNRYRRVNEGWWEDLSDKAQALYKKLHPGSKQAGGGKSDDSDGKSKDVPDHEKREKYKGKRSWLGIPVHDDGEPVDPSDIDDEGNLLPGKEDPENRSGGADPRRGSSRTGKELGETKIMKLETLLKENPAVAAAAAMATIKLMNPQTGRPNKAITALRNKDNPSHGKAVGIFQKLRDKFKKSDFDKEKDKVAKGADDWVKKQSQSDADFYKKQYAARTGTELGEDKMNESIKFHTITGNKRFMTKTALPILRKYGAKNVKVLNVAGDFLEIRFPIDSNKLKKLDKELKRKNKKAYGGIVEREEDILRKVIREEIKRMIKEDEESFSQPIPATIERFMKRFIGAVKGGNLNRKRKLAILGRTIVALGLDPSEVSKYARLVKREL